MPCEHGQARCSQSTRPNTNAVDGTSNGPNKSGNPRRRRMAIEDILNPPESDQPKSVSPSLSLVSESSFSTEIEESHSPRKAESFKHSPRPSPSRFSPYARSVGSRSPSPDYRASSKPRSFRPAYDREQEDFVWFHRLDLGLSWPDTNAAYQEQYPGERNKGGLQCKYYRVRDANGIPKCRAADKTSGDPRKHGMWVSTGRRYPWMEPYAPRLPGFYPSEE